MWQWILTGLILMGALIYAAINIVKTFKRKPSRLPGCAACSYDCSGCKPTQAEG